MSPYITDRMPGLWCVGCLTDKRSTQGIMGSPEVQQKLTVCPVLGAFFSVPSRVCLAEHSKQRVPSAELYFKELFLWVNKPLILYWMQDDKLQSYTFCLVAWCSALSRKVPSNGSTVNLYGHRSYHCAHLRGTIFNVCHSGICKFWLHLAI